MPAQTEGRVLLALQAYQKHHLPSLRAAAKAYDVNFSTLQRRHLGTPSRVDTPANSRKFTLAEEQLLVQKILRLCDEGFHPQRSIVEDMANTMLQSKNPSNLQTVGRNWVTTFVKRHPQLDSVYNRKFDYQRASCEDPELISLWFKLVQDTIAKYGVATEDIYNFDETGFQMGVISSSKVITASERRGRPKTTQPGNREWVTAIQCINAKGYAVPPLIIFAAENHFQKQKRARKKGFIRKGGSMTIQEGQESIERSVVTEQSHNNIENVDPAIPAQQQETVTKRAPSRCSKCGSFDHKARRCSS